MFHYVYLLYREDIKERTKSNKPSIYVGVRKSKKEPDEDLYFSSSKYIQKAIKEGVNFKKIILNTFNTREEALLYEKIIVDTTWIHSPHTYNLTVGGNSANEYQMSKLKQNKKKFYDLGGKPWNKDIQYDEKTKDKFRKIRLVFLKENPDFNEKTSNLIKELWKDQSYRSKHNNLSYLRTDEVRKKKNETFRKTVKTTEYKEKRTKILKELWQDPKYREKQRNLAYLHTEEVQNKKIESFKKTAQTEEYKLKRSEIHKRNWQDPEFVKKQNNLEYLRTEEVRKKVSETLKKKVKTHTCPHCGQVGRGPWMFQKHFDRCEAK